MSASIIGRLNGSKVVVMTVMNPNEIYIAPKNEAYFVKLMEREKQDEVDEHPGDCCNFATKDAVIPTSAR